MSAGAPVDFGGMVLPNPNNIKPMADTDQPPGAATPLDGATFSDGVYRGKRKMDTSNPAPAQILPGMMQPAATKGQAQPKDIGRLFADQEFQGFSPADKREALSRALGDNSIRDMSDAETMELVSRATNKLSSTRPDLFPPPAVPRPQVNMQQSLFGHRETSDPDIARIDRGINQAGTLAPMPEDAFAGAAVAGAPLAAGAAIPFIAKQAAKHPIVAGMVGQEAINQARKIPVVGKYIPPYAEMLPWLLTGGKGAAGKEAAGETASASASEAAAETTGSRVPAGQLAKETPNPDPYQFKGAPKTMDVQQSTNVGKTGYDAASRTMTVEYKSGQVYSYHGVPPEIYKQAQEADSVGSYISRNVKGRYETVRRGSVQVKKR